MYFKSQIIERKREKLEDFLFTNRLVHTAVLTLQIQRHHQTVHMSTLEERI